MANNVEFSAFTQRELGRLAKTFTLMGDEAVENSRQVSFDIAEMARDEIRSAGYTRSKSGRAVKRVVDGASVSRSSKTGRLSYGSAGQRFSGGATTQMLWGGLEFGSDKYKQFPSWSGRYGRGSRGWFIYPTLRRIQPELINKWEQSFDRILKEWA